MNKYIITSISYGIIRNLYYTKNITITEKINDNITKVSNKSKKTLKIIVKNTNDYKKYFI